MLLKELKNNRANVSIITSQTNSNNNNIHNLVIKVPYYDVCKKIKLINTNSVKDINEINYIKNLKTKGYKGIICCCPGPFTFLCETREVSTVLMDIAENKNDFKNELQLITEKLIAYSKLLLNNGADLVWFDEDYVSSLSKEDYWDYSGQFCKKIFNSINKKAVLYISKNMDKFLEEILLTEVKSISTDYDVRNMFLLENINKDIILIQNFKNDFFEGEEKNIIKRLNNLAYPYSIYNNVVFSIENNDFHNLSPNVLNLILDTIFNFKYNNTDINEILHNIKKAVIDGEKNVVEENMKKALDFKIDSFHILNGCLIPGINYVGELFKEGAVFIPELLMSSSAMYKGLDIIKPYIITNKSETKGTVVIGTVEGDLHDIGKNLVAMMLESNFYEVINLGTNVKAETFIEEAKKNKANIIGLSALTTSTMEAMKKTVIEIRNDPELNNMKIIVGGAPVSENYAKQIGADGYSGDAAQAVSLANSLMVKV